jgi:hypothetical protein
MIPKLKIETVFVKALGKNCQIPLKTPMMAPTIKALTGLSISTPTGGILEIISKLTASTRMLISSAIMDVPRKFDQS